MRRLNLLTMVAVVLMLSLGASMPAYSQGGMGESMGEMAMQGAEGWVLADAGLKTPESVFYDAEMDLYFVSNLGGPQPLEKDNNGFISKINPDGTVNELKWVAAGMNGVTLNAPKGIGRYGDWLLVTDIDLVRVFDIHSGEHKMDIPLPGATFANDIAVAKGVVYASDTGADQPGGVYTITFDGAEMSPEVKTLARGEELHNPNGVFEDHGTLYMVTYGSNEVFAIQPDGSYKVVATAPTGSLDGIEMLKDGRLAFSSWEGKAIYTLDLKDNSISTLFTDLESPADIGYDMGRNLLLVPLFMKDKIVAEPVK